MKSVTCKVVLFFNSIVQFFTNGDAMLVETIGLQKLGKLILEFRFPKVFYLNYKVITLMVMEFCNNTSAGCSTAALYRP